MRTREFEQAILQVVSKQPFFRRILLETIFEESKDIPTACVSPAGRFLINPDWFKQLTISDRIFVILHEILHIALCHFTRLGQRNKVLWNVATDLAINSMLERMGFKVDKLKEISLFPERFGFEECLSAEEYYKLLEKEAQDKRSGQGGGKGNGSEKNDQGSSQGKEGKGDGGKKNDQGGNQNKEREKNKNEGGGQGKEGKENKDKEGGQGFDEHKYEDLNKDEKKVEEIEEKYKRVLISAYEEAVKQKGNLPGWFEELVNKLKEPTLDWKSMLRKFCIQNIKVKVDWTRPNRRYFAHGIIYPSRREKMLNLVVAVDTSGSIGLSDLRDFFSEINGILSSFSFYHVYLIQNDAKIQKVMEIKYPDKLPEAIKVSGRGGTDFRPVFEYLEEKKIMYPLVFFTDLLGTFPEKAPPYPVLWITKEKGKAPFGITIRLGR